LGLRSRDAGLEMAKMNSHREESKFIIEVAPELNCIAQTRHDIQGEIRKCFC
jgi:hypothetical protein